MSKRASWQTRKISSLISTEGRKDERNVKPNTLTFLFCVFEDLADCEQQVWAASLEKFSEQKASEPSSHASKAFCSSIPVNLFSYEREQVCQADRLKHHTSAIRRWAFQSMRMMFGHIFLTVNVTHEKTKTKNVCPSFEASWLQSRGQWFLLKAVYFDIFRNAFIHCLAES